MVGDEFNRRPIIAVIGHGDIQKGDPRYDLSIKLGKSLIDNGYRVITGGYGGIMEGASIGARSSDSYREGDVIGVLKGFDPSDANMYVDVPICTGLNLARNQIIAGSDAVIAIGGGAGTLSEIAMAWQLRRLIIAYRVEGWSGKVADEPLDNRIRFDDIPDDRIHGVDDDTGTIGLLRKHLVSYMDRY